MDLFTNIEQYSSIALTWLGIALTLWIAYYTFHIKLTTSTNKEQLYKAYLPIFRLLEPHLYKDIEDIKIETLVQLLAEVNVICDQHYELIDPEIIYWASYLSDKLNKNDFNKSELNENYGYFCRKVDITFEKTRRVLRLPTRNVFYKLNKKQYHTKFDFVFFLFLASWKGFLLIFISFLITNFIIQL
ncbi:hypothetical protein [Shouchella clausii]|uniref:hypothetical protein n=1 Tax=Shouchella clausii TaxID=79880 RepID=UPI000BA67CCC|nr:hypothetical protein [Shouchella clausii]PAE96747.1 hypothetical protein CHH71_12110 [Shouchella clausii]